MSLVEPLNTLQATMAINTLATYATYLAIFAPVFQDINSAIQPRPAGCGAVPLKRRQKVLEEHSSAEGPGQGLSTGKSTYARA